MPLILGANSVSGYTVKNSLRFNSASNDNLTRTPASATNRRTFTVSFWHKKSVLSTRQEVFSQYAALNNNEWIELAFNTDDTLFLSWYSAAVFTTNQLFRDVGAWYHIVLAVDTTQATSTDRVKLYVNGSQVTSFSSITYPAQNYDTGYNQSSSYHIGDLSLNGNFDLNGYLAEYYSIDGQALTPSSFGETDTLSGIWIPKAYTGTYGTNGFYLQFKNSASLGTDSSGNGNTFTVNNLTSVDQSTDTPTNNFATLNPLFIATPSAPPTYTEGNLQFKNTYSSSEYGLATIIPDTGKWYFEIKIASTTQNSLYEYFGTGGSYIQTSGGIYPSGSTTVSNGDIFGFATDITNSLSVITRNGTQIYSGAGGGTFVVGNFTNTIYQINFGNPPYSANSYTDGAGYGNFSYAVPSGYYALNTKNLANFG